MPWQRVINAKGVISPRFAGQTKLILVLIANRGPGGAARQAAALRQEGVIVDNGSLGELSINFGTYGWFPNRLPSEEADDEDED